MVPNVRWNAFLPSRVTLDCPLPEGALSTLHRTTSKRWSYFLNTLQIRLAVVRFTTSHTTIRLYALHDFKHTTKPTHQQPLLPFRETGGNEGSIQFFAYIFASKRAIDTRIAPFRRKFQGASAYRISSL